MHFFAKIFVKNRLFSPGSVPINHTCLFYSFSRITGCFRANQARSNGGFLQKTHPEPIESMNQKSQRSKSLPASIGNSNLTKKIIRKVVAPCYTYLNCIFIEKEQKGIRRFNQTYILHIIIENIFKCKLMEQKYLNYYKKIVF